MFLVCLVDAGCLGCGGFVAFQLRMCLPVSGALLVGCLVLAGLHAI